MARQADSYTKFDDLLKAFHRDPETDELWDRDGLVPNLEMLNALISRSLKNGISQATGDFAKAFDCWAASELRRIGFLDDEVWPRTSMPRVLTREVATLTRTITTGGSTKKSSELRSQIQSWLSSHDKSPAVAPTEAKVLGGVYRKQADVLVADWSAGVELMISTKSMLGSYGKNLRNRFEESFGDAINLRQRFPLGAFGFLFVIDTGVPKSDFVFLQNMLLKLVDSAGYDATSVVLVNTAEKRVASGVETHTVPQDLRASRFFEVLTDRVLQRTPADRHPRVRRRRGLEVDEEGSDFREAEVDGEG